MSNQVLAGSGVPNDTNGSNGDYYFDNISEKYYIKENDVWVVKGSLQHPWTEIGDAVSYNKGPVSIGTPSPKSTLHVNGGGISVTNSSRYILKSLGNFKDDTPGSELKDFQIIDDLAYFAYGIAGFLIVNLNDPSQPSILSTYKPIANSVNGLYIQGADKTTAYIAYGAGGLHIINVNDPNNIKVISTYPIANAGATGDIYRIGKYIYIASGKIFRILEVNDENIIQREVGTYEFNAEDLLGFKVKSVPVVDSSGNVTNKVTGYLNYGSSGLQIVDLSDSSSPSLILPYNPNKGIITNFEISEEDRLYLSFKNESESIGDIEVLDVSNSSDLKLLSLYSVNYGVYDFSLLGGSDLAYLVGEDGTLELIRLTTQLGSQNILTEKVKSFVIERLKTTDINQIILTKISDITVTAYLASLTEGLQVITVTNMGGYSAEFDGSIASSSLTLHGLENCVLSTDKNGLVKCYEPSKLKDYFEKFISPLIRTAGEASILTATDTGRSVVKWDKYGVPTAIIRGFINAALGLEGLAGLLPSLDTAQIAELTRLVLVDIDSIITNTGIAANGYTIDLIQRKIGWRTDKSGRKITGWARQIGRYLEVTQDGSVVIGSGFDTNNKLQSTVDNSVVLGAGSDIPSIVISPGAKGQAGSVAVGHKANIGPSAQSSIALGLDTKADAIGAVVIGIGDVLNPLINDIANSVMLGAGSDIPSIVINPGAQGEAGGVAIGAWTSTQFDEAVVIGSGVDRNNTLQNAVSKSLVLGAGSDIPSIVISPGAKGQAGSVAVGHKANIGPSAQSSIALGLDTKADAIGAVVIGIGDVLNPLINDIANSVMLGAGSDIPSIVINPGAQGKAGKVYIGTDVIPIEKNQYSLGTDEFRWTNCYFAGNSIHIGEKGNESVISHDAENRQLDLGEISVNNMTVTGLDGCNEETNFIALDSSGKLKCVSNPVKEDAEKAKQEANRAEQEAGKASLARQQAKLAQTYAEASATEASDSAVAAAGSAGEASGSALTAAGSAATAGISAVSASDSARAANASRDDAERFKVGAETAAHAAQDSATAVERVRVAVDAINRGLNFENDSLEVKGSLKILGSRFNNREGYGILETDKTDWLRINPDANYPAIALYNPVAIGTGGLAIGDWSSQESGVLQTTQGAYLATVGGNVGVGTMSPENSQQWAKVMDIFGPPNAKLSVRTANIDSRLMSHDLGFWESHPGMIVGTQSTHALTLGTNAQSRMTLDTVGNVGIGTINPQGFHVDFPETNRATTPAPGVSMAGGTQGNASIELRNNDTGTPYIDFAQSLTTDYDARIRLTEPGKLAFESTNVGIGATDPDQKLTVSGGNIKIDMNQVMGHNPNDKFSYDGKDIGHYSLGWFNDSWFDYGSTTWFSGYGGFKFFTQGTPKLSIDYAGNIRYETSLAKSSSRTLKDNIAELPSKDAFQALSELNPVMYTLKANSEQKTHLGFIAEDVPQMVASQDGKAIIPDEIVAVLTKVVKEQQKTIGELLETVNELKSQINSQTSHERF